MSSQSSPSWSFRFRGAQIALLASLAALTMALATPVAAYVVVTADNRVYDVPTKPEVRGDLVIFQLDGAPVSLRVYEVNITKTNELNYMLDSGAGATSLTQQLRQLKPGVPNDDRMIVSSRVHQVLDEEKQPDYHVRLEGEPASGSPSFDDAPGPASRSASTAKYYGQPSFDDAPGRSGGFEREAREALDQADRQVRNQPPAASRPAPAAPSAADAEKVADLDAEIAAEQAYLKKLTSGEETVGNLEGAIDSSMAKIKRLQKRRDRLAGSSSSAAAPASSSAGSSYQASGNYPAGSREAKWEEEMASLQGKLSRLQSQRASVPADETAEREMLDEVIGETEYRIEKLQKKLEGR